ncbi:2-phosphosulfolactate phosphatase [Agromyces bauzanensis]
MSDSTTPFGQAKYQVRFDWGASGARRIVPGAHVVVLVDALPFTTTVVVAAEHGVATPVDGADAAGSGASAAVEAALAAGDGPVVLAASLRNRTAVAGRILALQEERGERTLVAIVAAGDADRVAIEDQLTAGAVVDALVGLGIDHTSPEAAVASAAFEGLRRAFVHLIGASGSGLELTARGRRDQVRLATQLDATRVVPELRDGVFRG